MIQVANEHPGAFSGRHIENKPDADGFWRDEFGYRVDHEGQRVDEDGNPINAHGKKIDPEDDSGVDVPPIARDFR